MPAATAPKLAPGPRPHLLVGNLADVRRDRLGLITRLRREYGDLVRFKMASRTLHVVSRPEYVRHVLHENHQNYCKGVGLAQAKRWLGEGLVTSEGEKWARQRRMVQPSFHRARLGPFAAIVAETAGAMIDRWRGLAARGEVIDLAEQMMRFTVSVIAKVMFSTDIANAGEMGAAFATALHDAMERMTEIVALPDWFPTPGKRRFQRAIRVLDGIVRAIVQEHRNGAVRDDLVSRLLAERDGPDGGFTDEEVRDQVMTILLAGHETTATSIAWTFHLLGQHPEALEAMRAEADTVLNGRVPTHEDVPRLVWARQVYEESLRLYPPVWLIPRRAIAADVVGGYFIPPDSDMLICPWVIHRHPDYWDDPETFDPRRFAAEETAARLPYTFLPFGAGPRACIGKSLAMMEALIALTMITQHFRLEPVDGGAVIPEPLLTLRFRNGIRMRPVLLHREAVSAVSN